MEEVWKPIVTVKNGEVFDFTGKYEINNYGSIRNSITGRILTPSDNGRGYLIISLYKEGREEKFLVHRIVASVFLENKDNLLEVNHRNEIKTDNRVDNLEWCDRTYNINYGNRNKKVSEAHTGTHRKKKIEKKMDKAKTNKKKIICVETNKIFDSIKEAYAWLGIEYTGNIGDCCNGRQKTAYGYHWKYVEEEKELDC